jgi:hypothetical protein
MKAVCERHGAAFADTPGDSIVGVADNVIAGAYPLNGLRHGQGETSGWFIWAGERLSDAPDFFKPTHARHLIERCPEVLAFLGLGEGWRLSHRAGSRGRLVRPVAARPQRLSAELPFGVLDKALGSGHFALLRVSDSSW